MPLVVIPSEARDLLLALIKGKSRFLVASLLGITGFTLFFSSLLEAQKSALMEKPRRERCRARLRRS
jgi:hypothetical protein